MFKLSQLDISELINEQHSIAKELGYFEGIEKEHMHSLYYENKAIRTAIRLMMRNIVEEHLGSTDPDIKTSLMKRINECFPN